MWHEQYDPPSQRDNNGFPVAPENMAENTGPAYSTCRDGARVIPMDLNAVREGRGGITKLLISCPMVLRCPSTHSLGRTPAMTQTIADFIKQVIRWNYGNNYRLRTGILFLVCQLDGRRVFGDGVRTRADLNFGRPRNNSESVVARPLQPTIQRLLK